MKKSMEKEEALFFAMSLIEKKGDKLLDIYKKENSKNWRIVLECKICGFIRDIHLLQYNYSKGCMRCGEIRRGIGLRNSLNAVKEEYTKRGYDLLEDFYIDAKYKMKTLCKSCNNFWYSCYSNIKMGKGCPFCAIAARTGKSNGASVFYNFEKYFPEISKDWDYDLNKNSPSFYSPHSGMKVNWVCPKCCYKYQATINNRTRGKGCPKCTISKGELKISDYLNSKNVLFIMHYRFQDCKSIRPLPFDFYLVKEKACIEFHGKQHYIPFKFSNEGNEEENLRNSQNRDFIKKKYCLDNDICFLEIPYWEIDNVEKIIDNFLVRIN